MSLRTTIRSGLSRAGFTLLEASVGVVLMSAILYLVSLSVDSGMKMQQSVSLKSDVVNAANESVNALALEMRYMGADSYSKTEVGDRVTYRYNVCTGLDVTGPLYAVGQCERVLVYDRVAGTLTRQDGASGISTIAHGIVRPADNGGNDGFIIDRAADANRLEISIKLEAFANGDETRRVWWEARQASVYLRSTLATVNIATLHAAEADNGGEAVPPADTNEPPIDAPPTVNDQAKSAPTNESFYYQIIADGDVDYYECDNLPSGLSINSATGVISGMFSETSNVYLPIRATNQFGTDDGVLTIRITQPTLAPPVIADQVMSGQVGKPLVGQIHATSPTGSGSIIYSWNLNKQVGLVLDSATGAVTGSPKGGREGTYSVIITVTNRGGTSTATLSLNIQSANPNVPVVNGGSATAVATRDFTYQITASNLPTSYGATGLPPGLTVNPATGLISGIVPEGYEGIVTVTLTARNSTTSEGTATLYLTVEPAPPDVPVVTSQSVTATAGTPFNYQIIATNSPNGYNAAPLPAGLVINTASGVISGTPAASTGGTTYTVIINARNAGGMSEDAKLELVVNTATADQVVITSSATASGTVGEPFNYTITATGSPTTFSASGLPAGVTLSNSGIISGTPTKAGTYSVALTAKNATSTGSLTVSMTIAEAVPPVVSFSWSPQVVKQGSKTTITGTTCMVTPPAGYTLGTFTFTSSDNSKLSMGTPTTSGASKSVPFSGSDSGTVWIQLTATATKAGTTITTTSTKCTF